MTTRTYYLPKNRISILLLNKIIARIECSIGDIRSCELGGEKLLKVPVTCNDKDVQKIEKVLYTYNMLGE